MQKSPLRTHIDKIPDVHLPVLRPTAHLRVRAEQTAVDLVLVVLVSRVTASMDHLPGGQSLSLSQQLSIVLIEQSHIAIHGRGEKALAILGQSHTGHRLPHEVDEHPSIPQIISPH